MVARLHIQQWARKFLRPLSSTAPCNRDSKMTFKGAQWTWCIQSPSLTYQACPLGMGQHCH